MATPKTQENGFWMVTEDIRFDEIDLQKDDNAYTDEDYYPDSSF